MPATVTTLEREIVREERHVGLPIDQPLTDQAIAHRRFQIAIVMLACAFVAIFAVITSSFLLQAGAIVVASGFGVYAIQQDRHLRRLALLRGDSRRITLVVASELMHSGALGTDRELLDLRAAVALAAGSIAAALADITPAVCVRVRLVGPSGELPVAAEWGTASAHDASVAGEALRSRAAVRRKDVLAVPMARRDTIVGVLEAHGPLRVADVALIDGFAHGVIGALRVPRG